MYLPRNDYTHPISLLFRGRPDPERARNLLHTLCSHIREQSIFLYF